MEKRRFDLEDRLIEFAVRIINVVESLPEGRTSTHLGGQLLRSATSAALNYGEAQAPESQRDFIHKLKVILKELKETSIGLKIIQKKALLLDVVALNENGELIAIFTTSIETAKRNKNWDGTMGV